MTAIVAVTSDEIWGLPLGELLVKANAKVIHEPHFVHKVMAYAHHRTTGDVIILLNDEIVSEAQANLLVRELMERLLIPDQGGLTPSPE